ncbi:hypothetical protein H9N25_02110 [Pedobacter riviphilus]|uniref:DUF5672 domain-containing protein n=1 Tax=Pedobacter riviphilus TaxID=2766984 RepID=A0ABX6TIJ6_9SPHI|nr:DUF5672 family protein [Pedobacter riviphilus]QNR85306.1 hypothetical protein H9N25_02110 [Pedobacter riviphilus]
MNKLCVVVPIHKKTLTINELISLKQCKYILSTYDVFLVFPEQLDVSEYLKIYPQIQLKPVNRSWLSSIEDYNRMKCSRSFYELFKEYDFLLTYELDSFIFSIEWEKANALNYDYIGAPWFKNNHGIYTDKIVGIGNSGFSIRNIKKCREILAWRDKIMPYWSLYSKLYLHKVLRFTLFLKLLDNIWNHKGKNVYFFSFLSADFIHEDVYWSVIVPKLFRFKLAKPNDALRFSFEVNPSILFEMNNAQLPIGCHAWEKYDLEFWSRYIPTKVNNDYSQ